MALPYHEPRQIVKSLLGNEDKRRAVEAALTHPYAGRYSNYQIAKHCGVNEITVRRYRESICDNVVDRPVERLVTRNGATYPMQTANIGRRAPAPIATAALITITPVKVTFPQPCLP